MGVDSTPEKANEDDTSTSSSPVKQSDNDKNTVGVEETTVASNADNDAQQGDSPQNDTPMNSGENSDAVPVQVAGGVPTSNETVGGASSSESQPKDSANKDGKCADGKTAVLVGECQTPQAATPQAATPQAIKKSEKEV